MIVGLLIPEVDFSYSCYKYHSWATPDFHGIKEIKVINEIYNGLQSVRLFDGLPYESKSDWKVLVYQR